MEALQSNVVDLSAIRQEKQNLIVQEIELILDNFKERSDNTYKTYKGIYQEFFKIVLKKDMEFVTWDEFLSIGYKDILLYRSVLRERNSNSTINLKIAALSSLYGELYKINRDVDKVVVDVKPLSEMENNKYGSLTESEMEGLFRYCETLSNRMKPIQKKMFFKLAYVTAIRSGALLDLTWKDISPMESLDGYVITLKDKGKVNETPITNELYEELLDIETAHESERVFPTTRKSLSKILKDYCKANEIDHEGRNIVLHSIKKASVDKVYAETGDVLETARHANHSGVGLIYDTYQGRNRDLMSKPSLSVFEDLGNNFDEEIAKYSKEEIIHAIKSSNAKRQILEILKS